MCFYVTADVGTVRNCFSNCLATSQCAALNDNISAFRSVTTKSFTIQLKLQATFVSIYFMRLCIGGSSSHPPNFLRFRRKKDRIGGRCPLPHPPKRNPRSAPLCVFPYRSHPNFVPDFLPAQPFLARQD